MNEDVESIGLVLEDEEGNEHRFEIYGSIHVEGQLYAILTPEGALEEGDEGDEGDELEVVVLRVDEGDEPESVDFTVVDDDGEFQSVLDAWEMAGEEDDGPSTEG